MARIELDPLPPRRRGSTLGLSPWERWLELCARIDGRPRHLSIHVGGMLVTRAPLVDIAPLEHATMPGRVVVQFDKRDVETMKLIKLDLLGLRMLSAIDDALRDIRADCAVCLDLDRLPEDIGQVFRMICAADTVGVFQIESRAQMQTLPKSRPETLDDLVVEVAIIRPGPIQGDAVHPYLRRRQGLEPVTYLHPTPGAHPGRDPRRHPLPGAGHEDRHRRGRLQRGRFGRLPAGHGHLALAARDGEAPRPLRRGLRGRQRPDPGAGRGALRQVAGFASFGFNKSHAAAFARTAYESAFLKLFYPAQFVAGLINAQPMGFYPVEVLINDAKRHGVAVLPVDVNASRSRTTTEWVGLPGTPLPDGAGIDRRPEVVRSPACVVPDEAARERFAAPASRGYGIRLGLHLVKGIGEAEGEALDAERARGGPVPLPGGPRGPHRAVGGGPGAAHPGRGARLAGPAPARGALAAARGRRCGPWPWRRARRAPASARGRPLDLRLPPTAAPDLPPPTELERLGDAYAILSLDARRQVMELFRPALAGLRRIAAGSARRAARRAAWPSAGWSSPASTP